MCEDTITIADPNQPNTGGRRRRENHNGQNSMPQQLPERRISRDTGVFWTTQNRKADHKYRNTPMFEKSMYHPRSTAQDKTGGEMQSKGAEHKAHMAAFERATPEEKPN